MPEERVIRGGKGKWTGQPASYTLTPLVFQDPLGLRAEDLMELQVVGKLDPADMAEGLLTKAYQVYRVGTTMVLVCAQDGALRLLAILQHGKPGAYMRELTSGLVRLARSWGLGRIETSTQDPRIARLLELIGARVLETTLVMEV